ncbi:hypothetical protein ACF07D_08715 [Leucobacter sp. NPDC015123]|uniref:hypothetical protein n=1 Tax=Leucobacter sp. NPDC015123 TaxID=3364129 RepID=UPI0036F46E45
MTSVTHRITQYNKDVGQPRGGLINPKLFTVEQLGGDGYGVLDGKQENSHASVVGAAVDYLSRLALVRSTETGAMSEAADVFRASLRGAQRISDFTDHVAVASDAASALGELPIEDLEDGTVAFRIDETAVLVACQLATYDVGLRAGVHLYNPESTLRSPDETTTAHILAMVQRAKRFFETYGPVTADGFVFVDGDELLAGGRGGYTDLVNSGDGDFLTADTLWDFKVSASKPTKDHTLQLLMYFLMGKASGMPEFATQTQVGIFNPRLNTVHRLAVAEVPAEVIEIIRRDVIGYAR